VGGGILILLGLFPIAGAIVAIVPQPVLGGAGFALFGTVAASGIKTLARAGLGDSNNLLIVAVALGFGLLPIASPNFWVHFPQVVQTVMGSGISAGCLAAIALNLFFNHLGKRGEVSPGERCRRGRADAGALTGPVGGCGGCMVRAVPRAPAGSNRTAVGPVAPAQGRGRPGSTPIHAACGGNVIDGPSGAVAGKAARVSHDAVSRGTVRVSSERLTAVR
jgi:hypothetical protein